jgi:predicted DNA-binding transcriptional regulator AlpA
MNRIPRSRGRQAHAPTAPPNPALEGHIEALRGQPRLTWRRAEIPAALGISERSFDRLVSSGKFPKPDRVVGRTPLWADSTVRRWAEGGGK